MKKKIFRILVLIIAFTLLIQCIGCSCKKDNSADEKYVHIFNEEETDSYVTQGKNTDYKLVIPKDCSSRIKIAKTEFVYLFAKATGITLSVIEDEGLVHEESNKYISLGETTLLDTCGEEIDKEYLGKEGARVFTKDNTIFIVGGGDFGTVYGVYTFMEKNFNFDQYTATIMEIDKVDSFKLKKYDYTDIPDIPNRANSNRYITLKSSNYDHNNFYSRLRIFESYLTYMPVYKDYDANSAHNSGHNTATHVLPYSTWGKVHPKWFQKEGRQLCYTAHGDEAEFEAMVAETVNKLKFSIMTNDKTKWPYAYKITIGMNDNLDSCQCDACKENIAKYGTESGSVIIFINAVADGVKAWMDTVSPDEIYYRDDLSIVFYAYHQLSFAPARYNEKSKEYEPIDEKVKLHDNVAVEFAFRNGNFQKDLFSEDSEEFRTQIDKWKSLGGAGLLYYLYQSNYDFFQYFYDSFNFYTTKTYRYLADTNPKDVYILGQGTVPCIPTAFNNLKIYLDSKLCWDTSLDTEEVMDKWFKGVYRDMGSYMKGIFTEMRLHTNEYYNRFNMNGSSWTGYDKIETTKYWKLPIIDSWISKFDQAKENAKKYEVYDKDTYEKIIYHIEAECLSVLILKAKLYYEELSAEEKKKLRDRLVYDQDYLGVGDFQFDEDQPKTKYKDFVNSL